jgi:hypothetical protein
MSAGLASSPCLPLVRILPPLIVACQTGPDAKRDTCVPEPGMSAVELMSRGCRPTTAGGAAASVSPGGRVWEALPLAIVRSSRDTLVRDILRTELPRVSPVTSVSNLYTFSGRRWVPQ